MLTLNEGTNHSHPNLRHLVCMAEGQISWPWWEVFVNKLNLLPLPPLPLSILGSARDNFCIHWSMEHLRLDHMEGFSNSQRSEGLVLVRSSHSTQDFIYFTHSLGANPAPCTFRTIETMWANECINQLFCICPYSMIMQSLHYLLWLFSWQLCFQPYSILWFAFIYILDESF